MQIMDVKINRGFDICGRLKSSQSGICGGINRLEIQGTKRQNLTLWRREAVTNDQWLLLFYR